jgi:hypothetical protein
MERIKVIICEDGITCKEVNPLGGCKKWRDFIEMPLGEFHELPELKKKKIQDRYNIFLNTHRNIESSLRVFKIENKPKMNEVSPGMRLYSTEIFEPGSTHSAEIIDKNTVKILQHGK